MLPLRIMELVGQRLGRGERDHDRIVRLLSYRRDPDFVKLAPVYFSLRPQLNGIPSF
jgi:hypothetical protein